MRNQTRRMVRRVSSRILYPPARLVYGLKLRVDGVSLNIEGAEKIPERGPCVIVPRHQDYCDTPFLGMALGQRPDVFPTGVMGDFVGNGLLKAILPLAGAIKIYRPDIDFQRLDREGKRKALTKTRASLEEFDFGLTKGDYMIVFAEENFSIGGMGQLKPGLFSRVADFEKVNARVAFVPVGIEYFYYDRNGVRVKEPPRVVRGIGLSSYMRSNGGGQMSWVDIRFGEPQYRRDEEIKVFMERVRKEIENLSNLRD
jgi:1-acyl-sn-glycerol-3-phosphate acyltransferase